MQSVWCLNTRRFYPGGVVLMMMTMTMMMLMSLVLVQARGPD